MSGHSLPAEVVNGITYIEYAQDFAIEAVITLAHLMRTGSPGEKLKAAKGIVDIARESRTLVLTPREVIRIAETRSQLAERGTGITRKSGTFGTSQGLSELPVLPS